MRIPFDELSSTHNIDDGSSVLQSERRSDELQLWFVQNIRSIDLEIVDYGQDCARRPVNEQRRIYW